VRPDLVPMPDIFSLLLQQFQTSGKQRFLVLIGGCSRTGKSTFAKLLQQKFEKQGVRTLVVSLDNWLLGIDERTGTETVRERYKYPEIVDALREVMAGRAVHPPVYDPKTRLVVHRRSPIALILDAGVCIVDGVIALDIPELRELSDFMIYTEIPDGIRKERLMDFYLHFKGCSLEETEKIIGDRELEEVTIIKETSTYADVIFDSSKQNSKIPRDSRYNYQRTRLQTMKPTKGEIEGVVVQPLKKFPDNRGAIMHGVRNDNILNEFGEVYFKKLYQGIINGWHQHTEIIMNLICVYGMVKLVLVDMREDSSTYGNLMEVCFGDDNYCLVHIPTGVANASQGLWTPFSILCNVASKPYDPAYRYIPIDVYSGEIEYDWDRKDY